jgi:hypothetical protein
LGAARLHHGGDRLGSFRERFFRAGHSDGIRWLAGGVLLVGILAQSGGFFIHLWLREHGRKSPGTVVTRAGALLIAAALVALVVGLLTSGREDREEGLGGRKNAPGGEETADPRRW